MGIGERKQITELLPCTDIMAKEMSLQQQMTWSCAQLSAPLSHWSGLPSQLEPSDVFTWGNLLLGETLLSPSSQTQKHPVIAIQGLARWLHSFWPCDDFHWSWLPVPDHCSWLTLFIWKSETSAQKVSECFIYIVPTCPLSIQQ